MISNSSNMSVYISNFNYIFNLTESLIKETCNINVRREQVIQPNTARPFLPLNFMLSLPNSKTITLYQARP
uniref:Uncharacterized protein n=1 Tax=Anguilla anguilla TaxID=7936 RepID=A0A0E9PCY4_ANGAN